MNTSRRPNTRTLVLLSVCCVLACGDDDPSVLQPDFTFEPEMSELWPNQDGSRWNFSAVGVERELDDLAGYATPEEVPPLPTFDVIYETLHGSQGSGTTRAGGITLLFDGMHSSLPGVQMITVTYSGGVEPPTPFCCDEALWRLEDHRVVGYSRYEGLGSPSWVYLTSDLDPAEGFDHILYEGPSYSVTLAGRVWRHFQQSWEGRLISCVEVLYLVDRGIREFQSAAGSDPQYFNFYAYGAVVYGQGIGPMSWREISVQAPAQVTQDTSEPILLTDSIMTLESVDLAVPGLGSNLH